MEEKVCNHWIKKKITIRKEWHILSHAKVGKLAFLLSHPNLSIKSLAFPTSPPPQRQIAPVGLLVQRKRQDDFRGAKPQHEQFQ
jgi:hypothetical protein